VALAALIVWSAPVLHEDLVYHAVTMTLGGTLISVAHLVNLRLTHFHVHDASCTHAH